MKIDLNDPQLTAYALGELHGQEAEQMKQRISKDPEAQKYVEDIQATAKFVSEELAKETVDGLEPGKRAELLRAEPKKKWFQRTQWIAGLSVMATASLAVVVSLKVYKASDSEQPQALTNVQQVTQMAAAEPDVQIEQPYTFGDNSAAPTDFEDSLSDESMPQPYEHGKPTTNAPPPPPAKASSVTAQVAQTETRAQGASAMATKDSGKQGLLSAFGGSGARKSLDQSYSGSGELLGMAGQEGSKGGYGAKKRIDPEHDIRYQPSNSESYSQYEENGITKVQDQPLSTFSIDVDTASYSNVRRQLIESTSPHKDSVRVEEMVNYFNYGYAPPTNDKPFATHVEIAANPWNPKSRLVRIALKGKEIAAENRPAANLVFLIDVSGSMDTPNKLPLVKKSLNLLVNKMRLQDRVAMVVYAGSSGLVLDSTSGSNKEKIRAAIDNMSAGGSTNGGAGIELAYKVATENMIKGGINRVILASDGDFNVGVTSEGDLVSLIEKKAKTGVFLSVLGFGMGNFKDSNMQKLSDKGNGNYAYIDSLREARKALVEQSGGTLMTIAKDVKIQVEFNPKFVSEYRLVGYEKRKLNAEDFNDDTKDAGEIGAGHTVTAFYEVYTKGQGSRIDPLKYQPQADSKINDSSELLTVKLRYKMPDEDTSQLMEVPVANSEQSFEKASSDFKFAAAVAEFSQVLKSSKHKGQGSFDHVLEISKDNMNVNGKEDAYRKEFVELVKKAKSLSGKTE
jgi:Ca-activated chloride channel homolog